MLLVLGAAACQDDAGPANSKTEVTSGRSPNASVSGTVTYRERIALTPAATLPVVETAVPLGSDFEQGVEYTVSVNSETAGTFKP